MRRLKRRSEFLRVAGAKRKWVTPGLILQARRQAGNEDDPQTKSDIGVGFTTSRRVGSAVARNRARRRLSAAVSRVFPDHAQPGNDFVVIGRAATVTRPFSDLLEDLRTALTRLGAYRDNGGDGSDRTERGRDDGA